MESKKSTSKTDFIVSNLKAVLFCIICPAPCAVTYLSDDEPMIYMHQWNQQIR